MQKGTKNINIHQSIIESIFRNPRYGYWWQYSKVCVNKSLPVVRYIPYGHGPWAGEWDYSILTIRSLQTSFKVGHILDWINSFIKSIQIIFFLTAAIDMSYWQKSIDSRRIITSIPSIRSFFSKLAHLKTFHWKKRQVNFTYHCYWAEIVEPWDLWRQ